MGESSHIRPECLTQPQNGRIVNSENEALQGKEVSQVLWKMITVPLQKGSVFAINGDSVPFWRANGHLHALN